jgi:hypothetical protein
MNCCTEWSELEAFGLLTVMAYKTRKSFLVFLPRCFAMSISTHLVVTDLQLDLRCSTGRSG